MDDREIRAFTLAPLPVLVPLLIAILVNVVIGGTGDAPGPGIILFMVTLVVLGYGATFVIGVPIHLTLRRFRRTALIHYLGLTVLPFALIAGAIAVWLRLAPAPAPPVNPFGLYMQGGFVIQWVLAFAAMAALSAATFWYAGIRQPKS